MKYIFTIILLILLVIPCHAQQLVPIHDPTSASEGGGATYLISDGFEESDTGGALGSSTDGYDDANVSAEENTVNPDYSSAGLGMDGSQVLEIDGSTGSSGVTWTLDAIGDVDIYCKFRIASSLPGADIPITNAPLIKLRTGGTLRIYQGSAYATTSSSIAPDTTYHLWWHYTAATVAGNDGFASVAFSTDGTRPTSGGQYAEVTTGNDQDDRVAVILRIAFTSGHGAVMYVDHLRASSTDMGDSPE